MTFAAETVPKPVKVTVQPPGARADDRRCTPRLSCELFCSVTARVSPAQACGTFSTLTWVTLPLLSTLRVAVSGDGGAAGDRCAAGAELPGGEAEARGRGDADRQQRPTCDDAEECWSASSRYYLPGMGRAGRCVRAPLTIRRYARS